jgi:predicted Zn-dependent peptidase
MLPRDYVRADHHGVPVLTAEIPVGFTGRLTFGVGKRDETARTAGIAHLVEHLVMRQVTRLPVPHNATTGDDAVHFYASGAPDQVGEFLNRVAAAIRALTSVTEADVARERKTIVSELGEDDESTGRGPLLDRYGTRSLGLLDLGQPAHRTHTAEMVTEFARRWLHTGNAVLSFTGAVPDNLAVMLPDGPRRAPDIAPEPLPDRARGWVTNFGQPAAFSVFTSGPRPARTAYSWCLEETLFDELRVEANLIYAVDAYTGALGGDRRIVAMTLDPSEDDVELAAVAGTRVLRRLAEQGPTVEVLERIREQLRAAVSDPGYRSDILETKAVELARHGDIEPDDVSFADVTAEDVRLVAADALPTLLWSLAREELKEETARELDLPDVSTRSSLSDLPRRELFRRFMKADILSPKWGTGMRGADLIVDDERIAIAHNSGLADVRFADLALAGVCTDKDCGHWDLTTIDGGGLIFQPRGWRGAEKALRRLETHVPVEIRYALSEDAAPTTS